MRNDCVDHSGCAARGSRRGFSVSSAGSASRRYRCTASCSAISGDSGWRHGIIRYGESTFVFFKLSSLRPGPDSRIDRQGIEVESRRSPSGTEFDIMSDDIVVVKVNDGSSAYEIALDSGALTAFLSWVESRPDGRARRRRTA
ncbi:DUF2550 domain-containing protein [Rhodococcus sp. 3Y1]